MATIDQDIIAITRTAYGVDLDTTKKLGLPFDMIPNTTLNEKFNVQSGVAPAPALMPNMRYMAIGNLGHMTVKAQDGSDETVPVIHYAEDAACWNHIPFVLRDINNDLDAIQRRRYALRVIEEHNGRNYVAYYLLRIDMEGVNTQLQRSEINEDGTVTTTPFQPTTDVLNPERPEISNTGTILGSRRATTASAVMTIQLTAEDVAEINTAHQIRTGSVRSPVISEIALCSGVDREVNGPSAGSASFSYLEAIAVQVNVFISTYHALGYSTDGMRFTLDVGGVEPMLGSEDAANASMLGANTALTNP